MKKYKIFIVLIVLITISCNHKNSEIHIEHYKNGKIKKLVHDFKEFADLEITFNKNEDLESIGYLNKDNMQIGYYSFYTKGNLYHQRQYLIINGKSYVNQYWNIDASGNIDKSTSNFYTIKTSGDTVESYKKWTIDIFLDCPYFGGKMDVYLGDYDENYNLRDSASLEIINGENNYITKTYIFSKTGKKIIRGIIYDWDKNISDTIYDARVRKLYFTKWVVVVDKAGKKRIQVVDMSKNISLSL